MPTATEFRIAVMPGDGIGPEVMQPCLDLLRAVVARTGGFSLRYETLPAGAGTYLENGKALPDKTLAAARQADAILLAAMGLPEVRYRDGTEMAPQIDLRRELGLYAGVRPVWTIPGLPPVLADARARKFDFVLIRESTEGLFASRGVGKVENDAIARETLVITRDVSQRLFDLGFRLAQQRKRRGHAGRLTCVDKANVFSAFAFFRKVFDERAQKFPDVASDHVYVDAMAMNMVRRPWDYDVLVTENMFGDILFDLAAGLMGGLGMAPSADIGDEHAVFQPCHGTAPDIMGTGKANPTAMLLSGAMMLDWLGEKHNVPACIEAGRVMREAVERAFAAGKLLPYEMGGRAGTKEIAQAVMQAFAATSVAAS